MAKDKIVGAGGGCFRAGTQVQLEDGKTIAIELIKEGDSILAFDERGDLHLAKVIKHHVHLDPQPIMRVKFWDGEIFITPNHWVLNQYNAFAEIQNLVVGHDTVVSGMGHLLPIKSKEIIGREVVYNLTVEPYHTFIADGIRVHNGGHRDRFPVITGSGGGGGKGGGGAPRQAVEASDTLQSRSKIAIIDLIGEGKIGGLVNGAESIFLNNVALLSESGQYNFDSTSFDSRDGSPNQDIVPDFASVETPYNMANVEITTLSSKTFSITNLNVDRVRIIVSVAALSSQNMTTGDINGSEVSYYYEIAVDGGVFTPVGDDITIKGKTKSKYQRSTVLTLPSATTGYVIRVSRRTPDSTTASIMNKIFLDSYVELTDTKLNYPNSALVTVGLDPTVFSSVPQRAYLVNGLYIQVPNNIAIAGDGKSTGVYTGIWNGGFTTAISSNPAWILYDLLTNTRYGLGNYLSSSQVDKSMLYTIGKYCDESVSDGFGGYEPRFSINTQIQTQAEAYKIISDITSVFRGMAYWSGGMVCFRQDSPATPSMVFNQANVVNGEFSYASSSRKDRHSVVNVTWNDPDYNYKQRVEYVEDHDLVNSSMGIKKLDTIAFGCSSRGQAQRVGRWILYTEKYESNVINFTVGLDSSLLFPGEIVRISDAFKAGKRAGGRILSSTSTSVMLDSPVTLSLGTGLTAVASVSIFIAMPDGSFAERVIAQTTGSFTVLTWTTALTTLPLDNALFVLSDEVVPMLARVLSVAQDGKHADRFIVSAVEHNPSKFGAIESGLVLTKPKTSITLPYVTVLTNLHLEESTYFIAPGIIGSKVHVSWEGIASLYNVSYRVTKTSGAGNWVVQQVSVPVFDIEGLAEADILDVKVSGQDLLGVLTTPITATLTIAGKSIPPKAVATFTAVPLIRSIQLRWTYPADMDIDFDRVNIRWSATSNVESAATLLTSIKADNYLVSGLNFASTPYYFWIKTVDTSGNESLQSLYVTASTLDEAGAMVTTLNGMLGSSALNAELGTRLSLAEDSFDQFQTWYYTTTAESWTAVNATLTWVNTGSVTITSTAANPQLISPTALAIVGSTYSIVKAKVNRLAGTTGWAGSLYYKTTGGWLLAKTITIPAGFNVIGGSALLEFNLKDVTAWMATTAINPVTQLRLDIGSTTASGDSFSIDWLAVGRNAPGASNQALVAAQTNISGLNASYTVKIDANGYVSGFGLASDTTNGVTTSSFAIRADKFSIANPAGPGASAPIVPFSVLTTPTTIDGSVFPAGVYINNAYITKITADKIDSRGLSIRDAAGNIILSAGNALDWGNVGGTGKPGDNATRNVYRGTWATATAYIIGDVVMDVSNYGWSCILGHTSSSTFVTPTYPVTSNTYWTLSNARGPSSAGFSIDNSAATFNKNAAGVISPSAGITLTTTAQYITSPTYQWQLNTVNIPGATASSYTVPTSAYASVATNTYKCIVTGTINGVAGSTLNDTITIPLLQDGVSVATVVLSNENSTFPASVSGYAGITFTGGACNVTAYIGSTQLTYDANPIVTSRVANSFSCTNGSTGATAAIGTGSGSTFAILAPTAMSAETGYTDVVVTIRDSSNTALTAITKRINYSLSRAGVAGTPATYVTVTGEQAFKFATGSATPTSTSITLTAALTGGLTTYQWDYWNGTAWTTLSGTVNTSTYALAYNNAAFTANSLRVRCISGTAFDEITIVKLYDGATGVNAVSGYLTNETVAVATDSNGSGAVYTNAGGTFKVFNGTTDVTTSTAFTTTAAVSGLTLTIGAATGVYSVAGTWTSDTASFTLTGVYSGTTITKIYTITKSKAGATGAQGLTGSAGTNGTDGVSLFTWLKYADTPTTGMSDLPSGKTYMGVAYNKATATESTTYTDYNWSLIKGTDGIPGVAGTNTYTWVKYGTSAAGAGLNDSPTGMTYIGLAFNKTTATESVVTTDYAWSLIQGATGATGLTGSAGTNGTNGTNGASLFTWLKYADTTTTGMSDLPSGKTYMGVAYNKTVATESTIYTDYDWSLIKGTDGINGLAGTNTYTWVKYGTSAAGAGMSNSPTGMTYIGLAFNKTTATESVITTDYTWSLIQGATGATGPAGTTDWAGLVNKPTFGNFAYLSTINSVNISTYIAAAAIGTAYIADANITTAKIADAAIMTAKIGDLAVDSLQIRGNAVSYITTYAATAGSVSFNIITHGTAAYPTSLVVVAKNAMYTYNATGYSTLSVGGVQRDQSMCASSGQVFVALVTECMINVTTSGAMTVSVTQSGTTYTGSIVVNVLEILK